MIIAANRHRVASFEDLTEAAARADSQLMLRVRTIFNRAGLHDQDLRLWRGILARIEERIETDS